MYVIEGNIGAGKSTLLDMLKQDPEYKVTPEPIEKWRTEAGNLLKKFYENPKTYCFKFQKMAMKTFSFKKCESNTIAERSLYSTYYVFTEIAWRIQHLTYVEYSQLESQFLDTITNQAPMRAIIYIRVPTRIAYERTIARQRDEEVGQITYEYIERLNERHDNVFIFNAHRFPIPIYVLDGTTGVKDLTEQVKGIIQRDDIPTTLRAVRLNYTADNNWHVNLEQPTEEPICYDTEDMNDKPHVYRRLVFRPTNEWAIPPSVSSGEHILRITEDTNIQPCDLFTRANDQEIIELVSGSEESESDSTPRLTKRTRLCREDSETIESESKEKPIYLATLTELKSGLEAFNPNDEKQVIEITLVKEERVLSKTNIEIESRQNKMLNFSIINHTKNGHEYKRYETFARLRYL